MKIDINFSITDPEEFGMVGEMFQVLSKAGVCLGDTPSTTQLVEGPVPTPPEPEPEAEEEDVAQDTAQADLDIPPPAPDVPEPVPTMDSEGMMHNPGIHSSNMKFYADGHKFAGRFQKKRGVSDETYMTAYINLKNSAPQESAPTDAPVENLAPSSESPAPVGVPTPGGADPDDAVEAPTPAAPSVTPGPAAPAVAGMQVVDFSSLLQYVTQVTSTQQIAPEQVTAILQANGVSMLPDLANKPELIPAIYQDLQNAIGSGQA